MLKPDQWTTPTRCSSNGCLSVFWRKSSYSSDSWNCIEARQSETVEVRDSKLGDHSPILQFAPGAWTEFLDAVRAETIAP